MIHPSNVLSAGLKRGDKGAGVHLLQEYLCLAGHVVAIDGDYGPATAAAVQKAGGVAKVEATFGKGVAQAANATGSILEVARVYLLLGACEVGGNNHGPWVRQVCDGVEGEAWCGYAVRTWARQAQHPWAERVSPSCDVTAQRAQADGRLVSQARAGDIFLRYTLLSSGVRDYSHMGVVESTGRDYVRVISGNSNTAGGREGIEVCRATYGLARLMFVRM